MVECDPFADEILHGDPLPIDQRPCDEAPAYHRVAWDTWLLGSMRVIGGSEDFPNTLARVFRPLAQHPDRRGPGLDDPARIPDADDERLRYEMPTPLPMRQMKRPFETAGVHREAGRDQMSLVFGSAHGLS